MRKNKVVTPFYVLLWDPNTNKLVPYDIMKYLILKYKDLKKKDRPIAIPDIKEFIQSNLMRTFWARCEYEILVSEWPTNKTQEKIDIYSQALMNIDVIVKLFCDNIL